MRAYVQDVYRELPPSGDVCSELLRRGVRVEMFSRAEQLPHPLEHAHDVLVVLGDLQATALLIGRCGVAGRVLPPYPAPLRDMLHRRVWEGTLASLQAGPAAALSPVFVKPVQPQLFGAAVVRSLDTVASHPGVTGRTALLCAEVVGWNVECRTYVQDGRVLGSHVYRILGAAHCLALDELSGPPAITVDRGVLEEAVARMSRSASAAAGYCLDFGVLDSGQTALVEANDAPGLANCGLPVDRFVDLQVARWSELMREARRSTTAP